MAQATVLVHLRVLLLYIVVIGILRQILTPKQRGSALLSQQQANGLRYIPYKHRLLDKTVHGTGHSVGVYESSCTVHSCNRNFMATF